MSTGPGVVNDARGGDRSVEYTGRFPNTAPNFGHIHGWEPNKVKTLRSVSRAVSAELSAARDTPCWRGEVATRPSRSYHCPVACRRCHPDHVITRGRYAAPPASARNDCWSRLSTCAVGEGPGPRER